MRTYEVVLIDVEGDELKRLRVRVVEGSLADNTLEAENGDLFFHGLVSEFYPGEKRGSWSPYGDGIVPTNRVSYAREVLKPEPVEPAA